MAKKKKKFTQKQIKLLIALGAVVLAPFTALLPGVDAPTNFVLAIVIEIIAIIYVYQFLKKKKK